MWREAMCGGAHGLLSHLALIHISRGLVVVTERGKTGNKAQHVCCVQLAVSGYALMNVLLYASNIHKWLFHGANPFRLTTK